jgi:hypothetical protein
MDWPPREITSATEFWSSYSERVKENESEITQAKFAKEGKIREALDRRIEDARPNFNYWWQGCALLQFASGNLPEYDATCRDFKERFRGRFEGDVERVVRTITISKQPDATLRELRSALPPIRLFNQYSQYYSSFCFANGILEFRLGHYDRVKEMLQELETDHYPYWPPVASKVVIAMCLSKSGDAKGAAEGLDFAESELSVRWNAAIELPNDWIDWFYVKLLIQEARILIPRN